MADYIKRNILSQAYLHIEPDNLESDDDLAKFKERLTEFTNSRVAFFLSPDLPVDIEFEEGSLIARITIMGTISLVLQGVANYKDFREGIQLIHSDAKRLTEYIISESVFEAGSRQQNVVRLEARIGIIGSIQKVINQLESIKRGASGSMLAVDVSRKIEDSTKELKKLMGNIEDIGDKKLVNDGLKEIALEIPESPTPPKNKVNGLRAISGYRERRRKLLNYFEQATVNKPSQQD